MKLTRGLALAASILYAVTDAQLVCDVVPGMISLDKQNDECCGATIITVSADLIAAGMGYMLGGQCTHMAKYSQYFPRGCTDCKGPNDHAITKCTAGISPTVEMMWAAQRVMCCNEYPDFGGLCQTAIIKGSKTGSGAMNSQVLSGFDANGDGIMEMCANVQCGPTPPPTPWPTPPPTEAPTEAPTPPTPPPTPRPTKAPTPHNCQLCRDYSAGSQCFPEGVFRAESPGCASLQSYFPGQVQACGPCFTPDAQAAICQGQGQGEGQCRESGAAQCFPAGVFRADVPQCAQVQACAPCLTPDRQAAFCAECAPSAPCFQDGVYDPPASLKKLCDEYGSKKCVSCFPGDEPPELRCAIDECYRASDCFVEGVFVNVPRCEMAQHCGPCFPPTPYAPMVFAEAAHCARCAPSAPCYQNGIYDPPASVKQLCDQRMGANQNECLSCFSVGAPTVDAQAAAFCAQCKSLGAGKCFVEGVYDVFSARAAFCAQLGQNVAYCGPCFEPTEENCRDCTKATANRSLLFARIPCCSN